MLENMRRQGASIFVYLIFCLLIAIFIINFRPGQSRQGDNGCGGSTNQIIAIDGNEVTATAYHIAYSNPYNRGQQKQRTYFALEMLIRRELLAQEADRRGLQATDRLVEDQIKKGYFYLGGQRAKIPGILDEDGLWNLNAFKGWVNQLNVSKNSYETEQQRAMLAWMMAQLLEDSVQVSREEAQTSWSYEHDTATYDVVAFKPENFRAAMKLTDADVERFLAAHGPEVEARYKADERTYKGVSQIKLAEIYTKVEKDSKEPTQDAVKAKLEAARAAIAAGKQKFAEAAKELATDEELKNSGGELGWRSTSAPALGDKAVSDAVKTLKAGEMTPVIAGDHGVYLVIVEDKREGDLTYDQVKKDIARDLARDVWGKEAARRAAVSALEKARTGLGIGLDQMYERETAPQPGGEGMDLQKILNDPNLTDEQKKQLLEMIMKQQGAAGGEKHGEIDVPGKDVPAGSAGDEAGSAAGTGTGAGAGTGTGSAAGTGSAMGSGAGSASAPPPPPAPPPVDPSKDTLPAMGEVAKAKVNRYGPVPREKNLPGVGQSKDAAKALFDELKPGMLAPTTYEAEGAYVIVQLVARDQPKPADFDKEADARIGELRARRAQAVVEMWLKDRCETLLAKNKIVPNPELLRETDDKGQLIQSGYRPCMSFH